MFMNCPPICPHFLGFRVGRYAYVIKYTERQKKLITSSERCSLKSTTVKQKVIFQKSQKLLIDSLHERPPIQNIQ